MSFREEGREDFLNLFRERASQIRHFPGCHSLELHRDVSQHNVYYTYSVWESEDALENYRHSSLFQDTWAKTKQWFADAPLAYSLIREMEIN